MLHRSALWALIVGLALLASPGLAPPADAQMIWVVDDDAFNCVDNGLPDFYQISHAVAAANPGDTIRVCPGDYTESDMIISDDELTITGSGASVTHVHLSAQSGAVFMIYANSVVIRGLDLDVAQSAGGLGMFKTALSTWRMGVPTRKAKRQARTLSGYLRSQSNRTAKSTSASPKTVMLAQIQVPVTRGKALSV